MSSTPTRPAGRTLIVTDRADFFCPKLLASVVVDEFEPLAVDVLRFGALRPNDSPQAFTDQVAMQAWPPGVREFVAEDLRHAVAPGGRSLDALLDGYARVAVYSINPWNAPLINHLAQQWPHLPLSVICSDDEIERHWNFQRQVAEEPGREAELREAFLYPVEVGQAFEAVRRFFIGRQPWEAMLRTGRQNDLELLPWVPPILNRMPGLADLPRSSSVYRVVLFPKPSVGREHFMQAARALVAGHAGRPLEIVTFRNDLPSLSNLEGVWLRCHPYPIDEAQYHRIIAGSHGLVIVPRGGLSTIRDAARYGLDLISAFPNTPNEHALLHDIGLTLTPIDALHLDDANGQATGRRQRNRATLARYEFAAIAAFRNEYCVG